MISYLPIPYFDESLDSIIGRYHIHSASLSISNTFKDFFNNPWVTHSIHFPSRIDIIVENTKMIYPWSSKEIINNHTLWPYFLTFVKARKVESLMQFIKKGDRYLAKRTGLNFANLKSLPKYCPECNKESLDTHGEIYWKRAHQIPDIRLCVKHNCFLEEIIPHPETITKSYHLHFPIQEFCINTEPRTNMDNIGLEVAEQMTNLLKGSTAINFNYRSRLFNLGLKKNNSKLDLIDINKRQTYFFEKTLFGEFLGNSKFDQKIIHRPDMYAKPTNHVLFDYFISKQKEIKLDNISSRFWDKYLFGSGPWECVNQKCDLFKKNVIVNSEYFYSYVAKRTIGRFNCICGMTYTKSHVIRDGEIKILITKFNNAQVTKKRKIKKPSLVIVKNKRSEFLNLLVKIERDHKDRLQLGKTREWLKKFDKEWYQIHQANAIKTRAERKRKIAEQMDDANLLKLMASIKFLKDLDSSERISSKLIKKQAGVRLLNGHIKSKAFLKEFSESIDEFRLRRIKQIAKIRLSEGKRTSVRDLLINYNTDQRRKLRKSAEKILRSEVSV